MKVITNSPAETRRLGEKLGKLLAPGDLIALTGELGAGKTLLVQGIAAGMGIEATVTSPTFLIIKEYPGKIPLYHMDAYRLAGPEELLALGYEEYFFGQGVTVIEWADWSSTSFPPLTCASIWSTLPGEREKGAWSFLPVENAMGNCWRS